MQLKDFEVSDLFDNFEEWNSHYDDLTQFDLSLLPDSCEEFFQSLESPTQNDVTYNSNESMDASHPNLENSSDSDQPFDNILSSAVMILNDINMDVIMDNHKNQDEKGIDAKESHPCYSSVQNFAQFLFASSEVTNEVKHPKSRNTHLSEDTRCINCGTGTTSLWRRAKNPEGAPICNSCGLYEKVHNTSRPLQMRKDSVLRRNRKGNSERKIKSKLALQRL